MNWLTNVVLPRIRAVVAKREVPDNLWTKCPACSQMLFQRDLEKNLNVCQHCGHHMRIGAKQRLALLFDNGDSKRYTDRLKEAQSKFGPGADAIAVAHGKIGKNDAVVACFEFGFMGGSMGIAVGEAIVTASRLAKMQSAALILVPASGGARMQEGILSLMQMPRTTIAVEEAKEAGLPYIVLLTDPTTGGVTASFAMLGDIAIAEPGAIIGFAGARVIEETIRERLPDGFQRSEYLLDHGMIDMVVPRHELRATLGRIITLLRDPTREKKKLAPPIKAKA
jgi:acetyl-CoA carboxylase carboxyl transferase subunit beta